MKLVRRYLEETINTKASQRRRISKLEKENGLLKEQLEDAKENEKHALNLKNLMKDEFTEEHKLNKKMEIELEELKKEKESCEKIIIKLEKELEKVKMKNENKGTEGKKK